MPAFTRFSLYRHCCHLFNRLRSRRQQIVQLLRGLVRTFRSPKEVNREAIRAVREGQAAHLEDLALVQNV